MKISVITVAYINSKSVIELLNSIAKYNDIGDELEVIIVDNSPAGQKMENVLKTADYKKYIYIKADNRGYGAGNNVGVKVAKGEILAFLNPDIILFEPIFKKIYQKFTDNKNLAWASGKLFYRDLKPREESFLHLLEYKYQLFAAEAKYYDNKYGFFNENEYTPHFCNSFWRTKIFNELGGFDENIFLFSEERDMWYRIRKQYPEKEIKFFDDIKLIHIEGTSRESLTEGFFRVCASESYICRKHGVSYKKITEDRYKVEKLRYQMAKLYNMPFLQDESLKNIQICEYKLKNFIEPRHID